MIVSCSVCEKQDSAEALERVEVASRGFYLCGPCKQALGCKEGMDSRLRQIALITGIIKQARVDEMGARVGHSYKTRPYVIDCLVSAVEALVYSTQQYATSVGRKQYESCTVSR